MSQKFRVSEKLLPDPSGERVGLSGREGVNSFINGAYRKLRGDLHGHPTYGKGDQLYIYKDEDGVWRIGTKVGGRAFYAYCEDASSATPADVSSPWHIFAGGSDGFVADPKVTAISFTISADDIANAPHRVVVSGREGTNSHINGGYIRLGEDFSERPAYHYKEEDLYLFFSNGKWKIGPGEVGTNSFFASVADMDAASPDAINVVWSVFNGTENEDDPDVKVEAFDEGIDNDLKPTDIVSSSGEVKIFKATINNKCEFPIHLMWIDQDGEEELKQEIPVGESLKFDSFKGHAWRVRRPDGGLIWEAVAGGHAIPAGELEDGATIDITEPDEHGVAIPKFEDNEFPPTFASLGSVEVKDVQWIRGSKLSVTAQAAKLFDTIEPSDLLQGSLGDCWLLAAFASVAEFPGCVEDLFVTKEYNPAGQYTVRLFDVSSGEWVDMTFDDHIPCEVKKWWQKGGKPLFAQPAGNELWCLLLEKAFAKFCGGYGKLSGGFTPYAWQCMTGEVKQYVWKCGEDGVWKEHQVDLDWLKENPRQLSRLFTVETGQTKTPEQFFDTLAQFDKNNYLMSAAIPGDVMEKKRADGLVERHAYSLLSVLHLTEGGHDLKLLQLRNPWGKGHEWNGDWGDKSPTWDEHPQIKEHLWRDEEDGIFWISFDDFAARFKSVNVCPKCMPTTPPKKAGH
mmetsp:Transcript_53234/g.134039  ORF Transcript_53234/g.134039 Transcript_53234/m.134039 type:complete len:680 (-) Transcript_53234:1258-3297(-)